MAKPEIGMQFTLPVDEVRIEQNVNARDRAREALVLDRLHQGEISTESAAKLLNVSREELPGLMYTIKTNSPLL